MVAETLVFAKLRAECSASRPPFRALCLPAQTFIFSRMEWLSTPVHYIFMVVKAPASESLRLGQARQRTQHSG